MTAAVNLLLFDPQELGLPLPRTDRRAEHVLTVLRRTVGGTFDAGVVNGPRGKATITAITEATLEFSFAAGQAPSPAAPITLLLGLPRPQTARDVLRDATTLGVAAIHFVRTEKSESSYAQSTLWTSGEWRRQVLAGAEQAFDTRIPAVSFGEPFLDVVARLSTDAALARAQRLALDNYESAIRLSETPINPGDTCVLAIGSERGWSTTERTRLRDAGFALAHLGPRVLRTETAVVAALTVVRAKLGLM